MNANNFTADKLFWLFLVVLLLWGGTLRFYSLDSQSLWIDESFSALASEKIAETGSPLLDSGRYYGRSKPHTYLGAFFIEVLGKNAFTLRLPSAIFGTAMILLAALSCRIFYGNWLPGIIAALLICFNYYEIAWSRQIRMYMEYQFFFSLTLLLFYLYFSRKIRPAILLSCLLPVSLALTLLLHITGILIMVPVLMMGLAFRKNITGKKAVFTGFLVLASALLFLVQYGAGQDTVDLQISIPSEFIAQVFVQFIHYTLFLVQNHSVTLTGILLCIVFLFKNGNREDSLFLISFLVILLLICLRSGVIMRSLFFIYPLLFYPAAHGLFRMGDFVVTFLHKRQMFDEKTAGTVALFSLLPTIIIVVVFTFAGQQYVILPQEKFFLEYDPAFNENEVWDYTPQPDFDSAYRYIEQNRTDGDIFLVAHTALHHWYLPETKAYWLEFLFQDDPRRTTFYYRNVEGLRTEGYMGYPAVNERKDLEQIFSNRHGFVIIDYYAVSTTEPSELTKYLMDKAPVVFYDEAHPDRPWTRVWVGRF